MKNNKSNKRMMLFSGSSYPGLTDKIAEELRINAGKVTRTKFKNGEVYVKFDESVGAQMYL